MRTIWKYPLPPAIEPGEGFRLDMPEGAEIRHFGTQFGQPTIWAEVDSDKPATPRSFVAVGTGKPLEQTGAYVGTLFKGPLVVHVYEASTADWTVWEGGDCPVFGTLNVDVRFRNGTQETGPAAVWNWGRFGDEASSDESEIVAYRISAEQPDAAA